MAAQVTARCDDWGAGGGGDKAQGGQFFEGGRLSAAGAVACLALFTTATQKDSGETEWANDKTRGGFGGQGVGSTVWCREATTTRPPATSSPHPQQQHQRLPSLGQSFSSDAGAISGPERSNSSGYGSSDGAQQAGDFQTFKELERMRGNLTGGSAAAAAVARVAAAAAAATASTAAHATARNEEVVVPACSGRKITDVYRFDGGGKPVGRGNRSTVSTATHRLTGQQVAVKRLLRSETSRLEVRKEQMVDVG